MPSLTFYQVDAFTDRVFSGNPAAVCPLSTWLDDATMQSVAAENNLAETAFFVPDPTRGPAHFQLRWFTPEVEIDLCGHATLASAFIFFQYQDPAAHRVTFATRSGDLVVTRNSDAPDALLAMDFPSRPPAPCEGMAAIAAALGAQPTELLAARDYLAVFQNEADVRRLQPDMAAVSKIDRFALIVTAPGVDCDFVSRFFAPAKGVPEDPVTGSAHCTLIPYWSKRLGKTSLLARQVSRRGGVLWCEDQGPRVRIAGRAVLYAEGRFFI